jgi:hypothetical protein
MSHFTISWSHCHSI